MALSSCHLIFSLPPSSDKCPDIFFFCLLFFFYLCCIQHTPFVQFHLFLVLSLLCHMFTLLPQCPKQQPTLLTLVFFMFCPSIHLSITPAEPLSQSLSLSLASLCCGLCLQSLSDLLSLLSAPLVRTKSSFAHGTTKDKGRNKRKEP